MTKKISTLLCSLFFCFFSYTSIAQVSTFDSTDEGWRVTGAPASPIPTFHATGGNPGGYVSGKDIGLGDTWYWVAPSKFLGNKSAIFGGTLQFDLRQNALVSQFNREDVVISGSGKTITCDLQNPNTVWTHYQILLDTTAMWTLDSLNGTVATNADIQIVLSNISSLMIRGEYSSVVDSGTLDNVVLQGLLYFRSRKTGNWKDINTWETSPVSNFSSGIISPATIVPNFYNCKSTIIQNTHTVTVTEGANTRQLTVESGAVFNVDSLGNLNILSKEPSAVKFYFNASNNNDGLIAEVNLTDKKVIAYFYGPSDNAGKPSDINSVAYKMNGNDTIVNIVLDQQKRPEIITFTVNGHKLDQIIKFEYISGDSIVLNLYHYDWVTNIDSLLFQAKGKDGNVIKTYGAKITNDDLNATGAAIIITFGAAALMCAGVAIIPVIAYFALELTITQSAIVGIVAAATLLYSSLGHTEPLPHTNSNAPTSPTSGFIPNPTGTPENPNSSYGKVLLYANQVYAVGEVVTIEVYKEFTGILITTGTATVRDDNTSTPTNCQKIYSEDLLLSLPEGGYSFVLYRNNIVWHLGTFLINPNDCTLVSL